MDKAVPASLRALASAALSSQHSGELANVASDEVSYVSSCGKRQTVRHVTFRLRDDEAHLVVFFARDAQWAAFVMLSDGVPSVQLWHLTELFDTQRCDERGMALFNGVPAGPVRFVYPRPSPETRALTDVQTEWVLLP